MSVVTEVKFEQLSNDLFWECYHKVGDHFKRIIWQGYDDAYWWNQVATSPEARRRTCECGKVFIIDFHTGEVKELIPVLIDPKPSGKLLKKVLEQIPAERLSEVIVEDKKPQL